jgi:hypothetical protein
VLKALTGRRSRQLNSNTFPERSVCPDSKKRKSSHCLNRIPAEASPAPSANQDCAAEREGVAVSDSLGSCPASVRSSFRRAVVPSTAATSIIPRRWIARFSALTRSVQTVLSHAPLGRGTHRHSHFINNLFAVTRQGTGLFCRSSVEQEPPLGLEPRTSRLQITCSAS